jgi:hypothetical protein
LSITQEKKTVIVIEDPQLPENTNTATGNISIQSVTAKIPINSIDGHKKWGSEINLDEGINLECKYCYHVDNLILN